VFYDVWWIKSYFGIFDNLCIQKVVSWFGGGQEFKFLSYPLTSVYSTQKTFLKSNTVQKLSSPILYFLTNQTPYEKFSVYRYKTQSSSVKFEKQIPLKKSEKQISQPQKKKFEKQRDYK
jgi:hypothetical protein